MDTILKQRVINRKHNQIGVVVAVKVSDNLARIGWSLANKLDRKKGYNKQRGEEIAIGRAMEGVGESVVIPHSVAKVAVKMTDRADKVFKVRVERPMTLAEYKASLKPGDKLVAAFGDMFKAPIAPAQIVTSEKKA